MGTQSVTLEDLISAVKKEMGGGTKINYLLSVKGKALKWQNSKCNDTCIFLTLCSC